MRSALSQEAGEAVRDGRLGEQHHPELGALAAHVTQQPQQCIRGHRALLSLVDDQNPVLPQQRVRHHLLQQESVCDKPAESRRYAGVKAAQSTGGERGLVPQYGFRRAAVLVRDPVAHLQPQTQVHLIGHSERQTAGRRRIRLTAAHQTLRELVRQSELHTPLRNLHSKHRAERHVRERRRREENYHNNSLHLYVVLF